MTNTVKNQIKAAKSVLVMTVVLASVAHAEVKDCDKKSYAANTQSILIAAQRRGKLSQAEDRRVFISEIIADRNQVIMDKEAAKAAVVIAQASVEIYGATLNNQKLNDFTGSGIVYGNRCYVLSVRHNVNKGEIVTGPSGSSQLVADHMEDPTGARVAINHGITGEGNVVPNQGTVISVGSFKSGINGEYALIRLDKVAPTKLAPVFLGDDADLVGSKMMAFGLPADKSRNGYEEIVVDPACSGIKSADQGIDTNCIGASGNSGGAIAGYVEVDKVGNKAWGIVGMAVKANAVDVSSQRSASSGSSGNIQMLNLKNIHPIIAASIKADLVKNPCKLD